MGAFGKKKQTFAGWILEFLVFLRLMVFRLRAFFAPKAFAKKPFVPKYNPLLKIILYIVLKTEKQVSVIIALNISWHRAG